MIPATVKVRLRVLIYEKSLKTPVQCAQNLISDLQSHIQAQKIQGAAILYDPNYLLVYERNGQEKSLPLASSTCYYQKIIELPNSYHFNESMTGLNMMWVEALPKPKTENPMSYAESGSKNYALGDFNDESGWQGCSETEDSTSTSPQISCHGTQKILVHGGSKFSVPFQCDYSFQSLPGSQLYEVTQDECN